MISNYSGITAILPLTINPSDETISDLVRALYLPKCLSQIIFPSSNEFITSLKYYLYWLQWKSKLLKIALLSALKNKLINFRFFRNLIHSTLIEVN